MKDLKLKLAKKLNMKVVEDLSGYFFVKNKISLIPYFFAKKNTILPLEEINLEKILVAIFDPLDLISMKEIEFILKKDIEFVVSSKEKIEKAIEKCYSKKAESKSLFSLYQKKEDEKSPIQNEKEGYDLLEKASNNPTIRMLNAIILEAIQQRSSDIHFDPREDSIEIRYRIDGVLQKKNSPPKEYQNQLIARIKVLANLDIAEHRRPQEGRIKLKVTGREIDIRVSIIPVVYGERVVLRILDKANIVLGLENLGMSENILKVFKKLISMPEGIILVTGPTGSGKTTTLYSAISEINSYEKNIMTIEDPVEYKLEDIAQISSNPKIKLTFASGLRLILRQDPDVIMIGEIRDVETAEIAIQSSLTGHLVFSTLHTNDAFSALTRLSDMGIEPYLLSSSIIAVLAQRLVRKICIDCKEKYVPTKEEKKTLNLTKENYLYKGKGCESCFQTGYKDRHGIYELMVITSSIKKQIMTNLESSVIKEIAKKQNIDDLFASAKKLVLSGTTTISEFLRVVKSKIEE